MRKKYQYIVNYGIKTTIYSKKQEKNRRELASKLAPPWVAETVLGNGYYMIVNGR